LSRPARHALAARSRPLVEHRSDRETAIGPTRRIGSPRARRRLASPPVALTAETLKPRLPGRARASCRSKSWVWLDPEQALAHARRSPAGRPGLLAGVRGRDQGLIDTVDMPTSTLRRSTRPPGPFADALPFALIRAAVVLSGKTVTTEFATAIAAKRSSGSTGPHTPWRLVESASAGCGCDSRCRLVSARNSSARRSGRRRSSASSATSRACRVQPRRDQDAMVPSRHPGVDLPQSSMMSALMRAVLMAQDLRPIDRSSGRRASAFAAPRVGPLRPRYPGFARADGLAARSG